MQQTHLHQPLFTIKYGQMSAQLFGPCLGFLWTEKYRASFMKCVSLFPRAFHMYFCNRYRDPILSLVYFPLLSICITWLLSVLVSSSHMWQYIFFYFKPSLCILCIRNSVVPHSTLKYWKWFEFSRVTEYFMGGVQSQIGEFPPVSLSQGFPEKEQRSCNRFLKHQQSQLDTGWISLFLSLRTEIWLRS